MYIVMIDLNEKLKDFLTLKFLKKGVEIYEGKNAKGVQELLETKSGGCLLISIQHLGNPWLDFLIHQRTYKDLKAFDIIVISSKLDKEFIQTLLFLSVKGFLPSSVSDDEIYKRLTKIMSDMDVHNDQRAYQRVVPREQDKILINISIPNSDTIISGTAFNISIGGVALTLSHKGESHWLSEAQVIERAQINLNDKIAVTGLKVIVIKENIIGFKFTHPTDFFLSMLGRYMVERLSGN